MHLPTTSPVHIHLPLHVFYHDILMTLLEAQAHYSQTLLVVLPSSIHVRRQAEI